MAKLIALEVLNEVLRNVGESTVSVLTSLTGIQYLAWQKITESIQDISTDENSRWQFLESFGKITLVSGSYSYPITGFTTGTDLMREDKESLVQANSGNNVKYITAQEFDQKYQKGISTDIVGYPDEYTKFGGSFIFNKQSNSTHNGKFVNFRYWKLPTYYSTASESGTGDIPEPFDRTLLVALATLKVLVYLGSNEAAVYKVQVFGDGRDIVGSLDKMKNLYSSPELKPRVSYQF